MNNAKRFTRDGRTISLDGNEVFTVSKASVMHSSAETDAYTKAILALLNEQADRVVGYVDAYLASDNEP